MKALIGILILAALTGCSTTRNASRLSDSINELATVMNEASILNIEELDYNGWTVRIQVTVVDTDDGWETVTYHAQGKSPAAPSYDLKFHRRNLDWVAPLAPEEPGPIEVIVVKDETSVEEE